jgi:2-polyprenyl-3-methyl-5-hydroxy-6-metoxy-1,4-benzoquinol methylase
MLAQLLPFTPYPYVGEAYPCNLCGGFESVVLCETDRRWKPLKSVACADCGLIRTDPMPTEEELERYYAHEYRADYQLAGAEPPKFHRTRSLREARKRVDLLQPWLLPGTRVLDVGSGSGEFLHLAQGLGCDVLGVEPGADYAAYAQKSYGVQVIASGWAGAELEAELFDVITCSHVVEHLREPVAALRAFSRWLKPEGRLYLSVPDMRPNAKPSFERFHFAHIHGFTPQTLQAACRAAGLIPVHGDLDDTTAVFRKASSAESAESAVLSAVIAPDRARTLQAGYPSQSILGYVLGGGYFQDMGRRFAKWRRDTFTAQT